MGDSTSSFRFVLSRTLESKHFIPICLISALAVRMCWIHFAPAMPVADYAWYYETATRILEGKGYSRYSVGWMPTAYHAVGYPAFLTLLFAVFGTSVLVGKVANVILYMGALLLTYRLAKKLFHSEIVARTALAVLSFYPNHIAYCSLLAAEILALFLALFAVALFIVEKSRLWKAVLSGMVFGLACLVRAEVVFLPVVLFGATLAGKIRQKALRGHLAFFAVVCISFALTILPWEIRNFQTFSHFVFITTHGGINLFIGNNPHATGAYSSGSEASPLLEGTKSEYEKDAKARALALRYVKEHPLRTIRLWPKKLYYLYHRDIEGFVWTERGMGVWVGTGIGSTKAGTITFFRGCMIIAQSYYMLIMAAFVFSVALLVGRRKHKTGFPETAVVSLWIIIYFTGLGLIFFGNSRFHFLTMPWIAMYVGVLVELYAAPRSSEGYRLPAQQAVKPLPMGSAV